MSGKDEERPCKCVDEVARLMAENASEKVSRHETTCGRMWMLAIAVVVGMSGAVGYVLYLHIAMK